MEFVTKLKTFAMDLKTRLLPYTLHVVYMFIDLLVYFLHISLYIIFSPK